MENYIYPQIKESVKRNIEILMVDNRLSYYAFKEWAIQSFLFIIGLIFIASFAISVWAFTDTGFYDVLIEEYPFFEQKILIAIMILTFPVAILSFIFSIYFSNRFNILALYRSYNVLQGKTDNVHEESYLSHGKVWFVFKLSMWAMSKTIHLSALQIKSAKKMQDKSELTFYDPTLVLPIVLFENLSKEEALKISSEINSKDVFLFIKQIYRRDFSLIGYNFKMLGVTMVIIITLQVVFGEYLKPIILFTVSFLIYFCIQTFAMLKRRFYNQAYLVAMYYAIRKNYVN